MIITIISAVVLAVSLAAVLVVGCCKAGTKQIPQIDPYDL